MVSVCVPSDALLQHLPSYLGVSHLGRGVSLHGCSSKAQSVLLTLDTGYLLTAASPDLEAFCDTLVKKLVAEIFSFSISIYGKYVYINFKT